MAEPAKITVQETFEAVTALRAEVKKLSPDLEKVDKINELLDLQEKQVSKLALAQKEASERETLFAEQVKDLETEIARGNAAATTGKNYKESDSYKALDAWVKVGDIALRDMPDEQQKTLRTDSNTSGGYLVQTELDNVIVKEITEISPIRQLARVRTINGKSIEMAIRNSIPIATYEGEGQAGGDSESTYRNETVTPYRQTFTTPITKDQLMDSAFNMESEIMTDAQEAFALGEGAGFVSGTGNKEPEGFLTHPDVIAGALTGLGGSGLITADDVILLTGELKSGYNPSYVLNRQVLAYLRTLKASTGQFLWLPGMNGPVANTLCGFNYTIAQDMPAMTANSLSIAFGDFQRGYTIIDRTGMSVVRDEVTQKRKAIIEFTMHRWNTGQVTLAEAITVLKTAA